MATGTDPRNNFTPRLLPWLLAIAAFVFYIATLNHWVSLFNLANLVPVAKISGWTWQPDMESPLLFLVTYLFRWLPVAAIPVALNLFSAVCATLTLGLLARSVAILAQDRTGEQRKRERNDFGFLTIPTAWLPPLFGVLVCGLQLTFWERATNFTGDTFDLLIFAFVIWSLLEYRLDERDGRLYLASLVYGAGMAENFTMVGFLPIFLTAIIWLRGFNFFNRRFVGRLALFGFIGTLFYLFIPATLAMSRQIPISFWLALKSEFASQWMMVKYISVTDVRHTLVLLALPSLVSLFVASIRWSSSFGDASRIGNTLATWMFHAVHALILFFCAWVMFDPPFSPRYEGYGLPCLPFYYLTALSIGYYAGYFLLVFRKELDRRSRTPQDVASPELLERLAAAGVFIFATVAVIGLIYKNVSAIHAVNHNALANYAALVEKNLPDKAIVLCDSDSSGQDAPWRMFAVQAALARDGKLKNYTMVDTKSAEWAPYHRYLHRKFPQVWPQIVNDKDAGMINPHVLPTAMALLSKSNEVYYLHPSVGYYFEYFYLEPHGAVYKMKLLPDDAVVPPVVDKNLIAENEAFWSQAKEIFPSLEKEISPANLEIATNLSIGQQILVRFHISNDPDASAVLAGGYFSRDLDFWGVQLQRAGELEKAGVAFDAAQLLNPQNEVAKINFDFNQSLREGNPKPAELGETIPDQLAGGPVDEPSYCFQTGSIMLGNGYYKQAAAAFERVRALAPDNLASRYLLAQLYITFRRPDEALAALQEPMAHPEKFSLTRDNSTELSVLAAESYFLKNDSANAVQLLDSEMNRHPADTNLVVAAVQAYVLHGLFDNALAVIDKKLSVTPDDPLWLFGKGYVELQAKNYDASVAALSRVLEIQPTNNDARFNRAIAHLDSGRLDAARADYLKLQQSVTNSVPVAYGLGEIAWRQHQTNEAIRNYEIYLAVANTNSAEAKTVAERLHDLKK